MAHSKSIAKRQHYHMRAVLRNFAVGEMLGITYKDGSSGALSFEDSAFYGYKAWSHETEADFGGEIERKAQGQIKHIIKQKTVCSHQDISNYHLFWRFRHMYAVSPEPAMQIYDDFGFGEIQEVKGWANENGKIYVNGNGTVDGTFAATLRIKDGLKKYGDIYKDIYWNIGVTEDGGLLSADCYTNQLMFPLTPNILLFAKKTKRKKPWEMSRQDVALANEMALAQCYSFCFGLPNLLN